jgi:gas vesicle protein
LARSGAVAAAAGHSTDFVTEERCNMARDDGTAAGTIIVAFVLGAVTGAAVALLMAPTSGEEARRILAEKAREGRERAEEAARQGREFIDRQRETLSSAVERGREAYNQARGATPSPAPGTPDTL